MKLISKAIFSVTLSMSFCATSMAATIDPFIQEWDRSDGVNTYKLIITKSKSPNEDYHLYYNFSGGYSETDMCSIISSTSFHCLTGETVTRDDTTHSVTLSASMGSGVFYDPNHMPPLAAILGVWTWQMNDAHYSINIMQGDNDKSYKVTSGFYDSRGNHCYEGVPTAYQVTKRPDGSEILTYFGSRFKFDPINNEITQADSSDIFQVGNCIDVPADGHISFKKSTNKK